MRVTLLDPLIHLLAVVVKDNILGLHEKMSICDIKPSRCTIRVCVAPYNIRLGHIAEVKHKPVTFCY